MDYIPETVKEIPEFCPGCHPELDFTIVNTGWCFEHMPDRSGTEDARVVATDIISGAGESGGEGNRRWCEFIHRKRT